MMKMTASVTAIPASTDAKPPFACPVVSVTTVVIVPGPAMMGMANGTLIWSLGGSLRAALHLIPRTRLARIIA